MFYKVNVVLYYMCTRVSTKHLLKDRKCWTIFTKTKGSASCWRFKHCCNIEIKVNDGMWGLSGPPHWTASILGPRTTVYGLKLPYIKHLTTNQTTTLASNQLFMTALVYKSIVQWF